jgi:hypothetical protein
MLTLDRYLITTYRRSTIVWDTFFNGKGSALILTKKGLGYILGDFLTNSSGQPATHVESDIGAMENGIKVGCSKER